MRTEKEVHRNGEMVATIKSIDKKIDGFGTLMQQCKPEKYKGKRIKMTGFVKSKNVSNWAGLWLRIDPLGNDKNLSFDNMSSRPIKGTTDWTEYEIVLDVPNSATNMAYGALLNGTGQIWFDNFTFEIVNENVSKTGLSDTEKNILFDEPTNLDFEK